jgi:ankyrin repeat protein
MAARSEMSNMGDSKDLPYTIYIWKALINAGADINGVDFSGNTPFHEAAESNGNYLSVKDRLESILKLGGIATMLNNHGQTALHKAASLYEKDSTNFSQCACERLEFLLQPSLGIDLHARDNQGLMAIHLAAQRSEALTWKLAQAGADLQAQSNDGHNSLHFAAKAKRSNIVGLICKLYKDNAWPIDQRDERGRTPLHYAAHSGISESVYYLLQSGANPNSKDRNGSTPLHMAAEHQIDVVRLRKQRDEKPQASWNDTPPGMAKLAPYMSAKRKGRRKPQEKENQNLSLGISQEEEALMIRDVVRQLLSAGADPGVHDASRCTAFDVSVALGNEDVVIELLPHMAERDHLRNPLAEYWCISRDKRAGELVSHLKLNEVDAFTLIETAVRFKSDTLLDALLKAGVDPKALGPDKLTNIHTIAHRGLTSMMKVVARYVDDLNSFWPPLLHVAASREMSNIQMIDLLIKLGVDVNAHFEENDEATSRSTGTPIPAYAAAHILAMGEQWWNIAALESLCHAGADLELMDADGNTVVQCALNGSKCGSWGPGFWRDETLNVLLKHGVNLNSISSDSGLTPLMAALQSNRGAKMIQMLLDSGADITLGGIPTIFTAIETGNADVVAAIISAGANVNTPYWPEKPRNYGTGPPMETPLLAASLRSGFGRRDFKTKAPDEEILNLLLKHGADPLASLEEGNTTVLHTIAHYHGLIQPILKSGISLEIRDSKARTLLLAACVPERSFLVTEDESTPCALIHAGVDINATDETGSTALHLAAQSGLVRTITLLLEKGASTSAKNDEGLTPLYYALSHRYYFKKLSMTKAFIKGGAELFFTGPNGESPLHLLAPLLMDMSPASCTGTRGLHGESSGKKDLMTEFTILYQHFVKNGCSIDARDKTGNTLLFPYVKEVKDRCPDYFTIKPPAPEDIKKMFDECDVFATNDEGDTLLHVVASREESEESEEDGDGVFLFKELMARGLDPRKENKKGASALDVAAVCGNTGILELFARHE